ncbi:MAG TPA: hypothetical protein VLU46_12625 [Thermoanaerobaculia bacterium]|nr:hypothetical protein [Thermoanaerobaculia bacterium]
MRVTPQFVAFLDEHFPEEADIVRKKLAIRKSSELLHEDVPSVQAWMDVMRDRARDVCDPED